MLIDLVHSPEENADYSGKTAIIIDVLRASTTIVTALGNGAQSIFPVTTVSDARRLARQNKSALLCGERGGLKPSGFDLGNSPLEYSEQKVAGRQLILTTSNGTKAISACRTASLIIIGCFLNLESTVTMALTQNRDIMLVCSGNDGRVSIDDLLCAALMIRTAEALSGPDIKLSDAARWAQAALRGCFSASGVIDADQIRRFMGDSYHGKKLIGLGFSEDVDFCSRLNTSNSRPWFDKDKLLI